MVLVWIKNLEKNLDISTKFSCGLRSLIITFGRQLRFSLNKNNGVKKT